MKVSFQLCKAESIRLSLLSGFVAMGKDGGGGGLGDESRIRDPRGQSGLAGKIPCTHMHVHTHTHAHIHTPSSLAARHGQGIRALRLGHCLSGLSDSGPPAWLASRTS